MKTMKNTIYTVLIGLALVFTGTSCSSDDDGGSGGNAAAGTIQAKVNGSNFASTPALSMATQTTVGSTVTVTLQGTNNAGRTISLIMNGLTGTGTFQIGGGANISIAASYSESNPSNPMDIQIWQAPFDDTVAGEVKINELTSTTVKGTFSFTGKNVNGDNSTKQITEGSFNMSF